MSTHTHTHARPIRELARLTFATPVSLAYLAIVGVAIAVAAVQPLFSDVSGSMIWVWPALLTLPTNVPLMALGEAIGGAELPGLFVGSIVIAALVQSLALGALTEFLRGRLTRPGTVRS